MKAVPKRLYTLAFSSRVRQLQTKFTFGLKPNTYRIHWQIGQGYFYLDQPIIQGFIGKVKKLLFHISIASRGSFNLGENMLVKKHGGSKTSNDFLNLAIKTQGGVGHCAG